MRRIMLICLCVVLSASSDSYAKRKTQHLEQSLGWTNQPLSKSALAERISSAALEYQAHAPIPRVAFYDVAYPASKEECDTLNGNAIVLISALVQDSTELPLTSVYLDGPRGKTKLKPFLLALTRVQDSTGVVSSTFGSYREDVILILPLDVWFGGTQLLVDFAKGRKAFRVGSHEKGIPPEVSYLSDAVLGKPLSDTSAARRLILREFPEMPTAEQ